MILGRLKSFPVVANGYQVVTRVVFTPTVVIEQPVSAQHAVFDTLDQMWNQFDRFGGFLAGYKGLLRVRMMNLNMQNVHRYQVGRLAYQFIQDNCNELPFRINMR